MLDENGLFCTRVRFASMTKNTKLVERDIVDRGFYFWKLESGTCRSNQKQITLSSIISSGLVLLSESNLFVSKVTSRS